MWAATPRNREVARVLRAEVADDGAGLECMVCMERPRAIRHQCGHATLCEGCNETYMRQPMSSRKRHSRIFISCTLTPPTFE